MAQTGYDNTGRVYGSTKHRDWESTDPGDLNPAPFWIAGHFDNTGQWIDGRWGSASQLNGGAAAGIPAPMTSGSPAATAPATGAGTAAGAGGTTGATTATGAATASAAAGTPWWQSVIPALVNAGVAVKGMHDQGKKPNFYTAPQTPQDAWKEQQTRNEFDYFAKWFDQFMRGMSNLNPDFKMANSDVGNPAFMGGVKVPTFDFSKMGSPASPMLAASTTTSGAPNAALPQTANSSGIDWSTVKSYGSGAVDFVTQMQKSGADGATIMAAVKKIFGGGDNQISDGTTSVPPNATQSSIPTSANPFAEAMGAGRWA